MQEFFARISKHYELVLFSKSEASFTRKVAQIIDPGMKYLRYIYDEHKLVRSRVGVRNMC